MWLYCVMINKHIYQKNFHFYSLKLQVCSFTEHCPEGYSHSSKTSLGKFSKQTDTDDFSLQILGYALIVNYLFNCHSNSLIRPTHQSLEWISSTLEKIPLSEGVQVRVMSWCKSWNEFFFPEGVIQTLVFVLKPIMYSIGLFQE